MRWVTATVVALVLATPAGTSAEQLATPGPEQVRLYLAGVEAHETGEFATAIASFRAALAFGDLNVVHLGLGRSLFASGDCSGAVEHYRKAADAPAVESPSREKVEDRLGDYWEEVHGSCPGSLSLKGEPDDMFVAVDDQPAVACDGSSWALKPGPHQIHGFAGEGRVEAVVHVIGGENVEFIVVLPVTAAAPEAPPGEVDPLLSWGVGVAAVGLAGFGTTLVLDLTLQRDRVDEYETTRAAYLAGAGSANRAELMTREQRAVTGARGVITGYVLSGVVVTAGLVMCATSWWMEEETGAAIGLLLTPHGVGLTARVAAW